jgi:hypothetical protein
MVDFAKKKHDERQADHVKFDFLGMSPDFYTKILDDLPVAIMAVDPETFVISYIRLRGQRLTVTSVIDSTLPFGGIVGRADWAFGRGMGNHWSAPSA